MDHYDIYIDEWIFPILEQGSFLAACLSEGSLPSSTSSLPLHLLPILPTHSALTLPNIYLLSTPTLTLTPPNLSPLPPPFPFLPTLPTHILPYIVKNF